MFCIQNKIIFVSSLVMFCVISYDIYIYIYIIYVPPPPPAKAEPIRSEIAQTAAFHHPFQLHPGLKFPQSEGFLLKKNMGTTPLQSLTLHPLKNHGPGRRSFPFGEWQVFRGELFHFGRVCSTLEVKVKLFPTPRHRVDPTIQSIHQLGSSIMWISLTNQHQSRQMH